MYQTASNHRVSIITNMSNGSKTLSRFKWTKEKSQVAMNLVKHGCKPKLVSVAVGCSLRTAQKFVETVTPKIEGESFKDYEIRRRGRKSKDVNQRLEAIREVLSRDTNKTQVEIAADLKVSNTTVCRDLKRIGARWKEKKNTDQQNADGSTKKESKKDRQSVIKRTPSTLNKKSRGKQKTESIASLSPKRDDMEVDNDAPNRVRIDIPVNSSMPVDSAIPVNSDTPVNSAIPDPVNETIDSLLLGPEQVSLLF